MSDLVRYPVGNTIDRDYINWPTLLRSETGLSTDDQDKIWPVDISLDQVTALCWRIRKWKLSGSSTVTLNYDDGIHTPIAVTAVATIADHDIFVLKSNGSNLVEATREQDLISLIFDPIRYQALVNGGIGAPDASAPVSSWIITGDESETGSTPSSGAGRLQPIIFQAGVLYDEATKVFSPPFSGPGNLIPNFLTPGGSSIFQLSAQFKKNPQTLLSGIGPLALLAPASISIVPGIASSFNVPIELAWRLIGEDAGSSINGTGSGNYTLQAVEYWPYENSLHLPVWSSVDGSSVNDPFS